jgi:hypothetical protein
MGEAIVSILIEPRRNILLVSGDIQSSENRRSAACRHKSHRPASSTAPISSEGKAKNNGSNLSAAGGRRRNSKRLVFSTINTGTSPDGHSLVQTAWKAT